MAPRRRSPRTPDAAHIVVTERDGTTTSLLLSTPLIPRGAITGQNQVVTTGDTAMRADQRTPQVIWANQQGGMGEFAYTETEGIESFTISDCDTRYPGQITLPPGVTTLLGTVFITSDNPNVIEYVGLPNARLVSYARWSPGQSSSMTASMRRYQDGTGWIDVTNTTGDYGGLTGFVRYNGRYYLAALTPTAGLLHTADMLSLTRSPYVIQPGGIAVHDGKFFAWNNANNRLEWTLDPTIATGWAVSAGTLYMQPGERATQLLVWRDAGGRAAIYLLTTQRLIVYDEDADVYSTFYDFTQLVVPFTTPHAHTWHRDGNLYLVLDNPFDQNVRDTIIWFSGTTNMTGPNAKGGQPAASRVGFRNLAGGLHWLYCWGASVNTFTTPGRLLAMNDQQGFHTLFTGYDAGGGSVTGGGYAAGTAWITLKDEIVREISIPDNTITPLLANGRTYRTGFVAYHEYAYTDGGTANLDKLALWVTLTALDHTNAAKTPGLPANTQIVVQYQRDIDSAWTTLATLTSADRFPRDIPINDGFGVQFRQIKLRLGLSSTVPDNTPIVTSVALAYVRQEVPRYARSAVVDLGYDDHGFYRGRDRAQLLATIDRWTRPGNVVQLAYAGGDNPAGQRPATSTIVGNCTVEYGGQDNPETGPGMYTLVFSDISAPNSQVNYT